ncbi:proton-conducting transporter transmembrane domain-containing protein [Thermococcus zilligii]|uniref:proton-conducting transporter transmembrane domain-containing protein n=1 Tax=Thermococcus zilligii TaxID=54076 RepID=UPI000299F44A|nr:proton-conducting transporter membrane subunit [Thermococcus zilligii]
MIVLLAALPLLFAFLTALTVPLRLEKWARHTFLAGSLLPWIVYLIAPSESQVIGGWDKIGGIEVALDAYSSLLILGELILFSAVALYSLDYFREPKAFTLMLLLHSGLLGSFISRDLFNFYIFMEIASVSSFALVGFAGGRAVRSAYKYLMLSLLTSYFFVLSIGIIYLKTGYLNLALIAESASSSRELSAAVAIAFASLLLKAGIFPLHTWLPDAHSNAPSPVSALLSGAAVKAPAYGMLLLSLHLPVPETLKTALLVVAFSSMLFGVGMALLQKDIKRLLAYHTVSQMGYVLLGIATSNPLGSVYYAFGHALFKGGLFLSAGAMVDRQGTRDLEKLSYRGDAFLMLSTIMLSLAIGGVWPFIGSVGKASLLKELTMGRELFYLAGLGTLASFTKLNYHLLHGKGPNFSFRSLPAFLMALTSLIAGVALGATAKAVDACMLAGGVALFALLKKAGLLGIELKKEEIGPREINTGAALFALLLLALIYLAHL